MAKQFDFIVVGSGLAGLTFALHACRHGDVCVLTKGQISDSNTSWAQGGIAAAVGEADSWRLHEEDTLIAGAGLSDPDAVRFLVQSAPEAIRWLTSLGARFDANGDSLALGLEGGHSQHRIVHRGDTTGWEVENTVVRAVREQPNITVFQHAFVTDLLMPEGACRGVRAHIDGLEWREFHARAVLLATGGCGKMYQHTTNPAVATGDGLALAAGVGAPLVGMEFMQFHPTTLYHPQMRSFLITEAVRGAGGTLRNHLGRRFMVDYDARMELAPRDVVSRAIVSEMKRLNTWCVYLDTTHLPAERLQAEFPNVYETLRSVGIQMESDWIPVVPAQHYSCGGIRTDLDGRTEIEGLYAAGEVASTGVHGANRLASNSLLEALVFAKAAAESAADQSCSHTPAEFGPPPAAFAEADSVRVRRLLQGRMTDHVGIVRNFAGLAAAAETVQALRNEIDALPAAPYSPHPFETRNLLVAAASVIDGARLQARNVGLHYNADLPSDEPRRISER